MSTFDYIGHFIRSYRLSHNISMDALAQKSGVSKSMIANIESAQKVPTIVVLDKLAQAMSISLATLVSPPITNKKVQLFEATAHNQVSKVDASFVIHRVMPQMGNIPIEFYRFYFTKHSKTTFLSNATAGAVKHLWVEQGELQVYLSYEEVTLRAGQLLRFPAANPHRFACRHGELAKGAFFVSFENANDNEAPRLIEKERSAQSTDTSTKMI